MSDLEKLIAKADEEVRAKKQQAHSTHRASRTVSSQKFNLVGWIGVGVILCAALVAISLSVMPVSKQAIRADLEATLTAAHDTVEEYRRINGRLPERIPVTALAGLVRFEPTNGGYRLSTTINDMTLSRTY
jgi:uncharacterized membrane protein YukC